MGEAPRMDSQSPLFGLATSLSIGFKLLFFVFKVLLLIVGKSLPMIYVIFSNIYFNFVENKRFVSENGEVDISIGACA